MSNDVAPTLTLAKLYESQDQFLDAFLVYQKLNSDNPSQEINDKLKELQEKIFSSLKSDYDAVINKIFTPEERKKFRILPHEDYIEMTKVEDDIENITDITDSFPENDFILGNGDKEEEIDLSDLSNGAGPNLELNGSREIETESVDVLDQSMDNINDQVSFEKESTEPDQEGQTEDAVAEKGSEQQSISNDDEMAVSSILKEMQSVDTEDFSKFLKEKEKLDTDLGDLKLSQLQEILKRYRDEK